MLQHPRVRVRALHPLHQRVADGARHARVHQGQAHEQQVGRRRGLEREVLELVHRVLPRLGPFPRRRVLPPLVTPKDLASLRRVLLPALGQQHRLFLLGCRRLRDYRLEAGERVLIDQPSEQPRLIEEPAAQRRHRGEHLGGRRRPEDRAQGLQQNLIIVKRVAVHCGYGFAGVGGELGEGLARRDGSRVVAGVFRGGREVREVNVREVGGHVAGEELGPEGGRLGQLEEKTHVAVEHVRILHDHLHRVKQPLHHLAEARPLIDHVHLGQSLGHARDEGDGRITHLGHVSHGAFLQHRATDQLARLPPVRPSRGHCRRRGLALLALGGR
mmetsp:Transcript_43288/g.117238  ORF Transcript_43288/g.117238 Transcript_43288/m.117238 type:complete len:329 (+) Transcript_43288:974-1960(+)